MVSVADHNGLRDHFLFFFQVVHIPWEMEVPIYIFGVISGVPQIIDLLPSSSVASSNHLMKMLSPEREELIVV